MPRWLVRKRREGGGYEDMKSTDCVWGDDMMDDNHLGPSIKSILLDNLWLLIFEVSPSENLSLSTSQQ